MDLRASISEAGAILVSNTSLLCRTNYFTRLSLTSASLQVTGHTGEESLAEALKGAELVIIPAGVPRKPGMTRDDLFNINAGIVRNLAEAITKHAPGVSGRMLAMLRVLQALQLLIHASPSMSWLSRTLWL